MPRADTESRLEAFDLLKELKKNNISRKVVIDKIHTEFNIPIATLYNWYKSKYFPHGRKGKIIYQPELFYVLGALLGDGCVYSWRVTQNHVILVGDYNFTKKYAKAVTKCTATETKPYIDRSKNIWVVRSNNFGLHSLFKKLRENLDYLKRLIKQVDKKSTLFFIEGFFDAEGCVKIIKEKARKTPKVCLDITNTNFEILELLRKLLKEQLNIESRYSAQKSFIGRDNFRRQETYRLRIYKKEYIKRFFENISTTKLKEEKIPYVQNWLKRSR